MPVMPSFSSWGPKPELANAYLGGRAAKSRDVQIANQAAQASQQLSMQQQQLAQQSQQAAMEMKLKEQQLRESALRSAQEMKIKQQYDQQMVALKQQELQGQQASLKLKSQEAAQQYAMQQQYQKMVADLVNSQGLTMSEAAAKASMMIGPSSQGLSGSGFASIVNNGTSPQAQMPEAIARQVKNESGQPVPNLLAIPTSRTTQQLFNQGQSDLGQQRFELSKETSDVRAIQSEIKRLTAEINSPLVAAQEGAYQNYKNRGAKIPAIIAEKHDRFIATQRKIDKLTQKIPAIATEPSSGRRGEPVEFKDGIPVFNSEADAEAYGPEAGDKLWIKGIGKVSWR